MRQNLAKFCRCTGKFYLQNFAILQIFWCLHRYTGTEFGQNLVKISTKFSNKYFSGLPIGNIPVDPFAKVATELQNGDRIFIETDEVPQPGSYDGGGRGWLVRIG